MEPDRIKAIAVRPGDVLVLEFGGVMSRVAKDAINASFCRELPGVKGMILDRGIKLAKVIRPLSAMRSRHGRRIGRMAAG